MKHTICCLAGKRLEIKPSPTSPGCVLVQILGADRQIQASLTIDAETIGVVPAAFETAGAAAWELVAARMGSGVHKEAMGV